MEDLARLSFKRKPLYVGIDDSKATATREGLEQVRQWGTASAVLQVAVQQSRVQQCGWCCCGWGAGWPRPLVRRLLSAAHPAIVQGYCVVPADKRFLLLFTFLKKNASKKV